MPRGQRGGAPLGLVLEKTRRRLGYTVEMVSQLTNIDHHQLNQFESGLRSPSASDLQRLADFYGVAIERFTPSAHAEAGRDSHRRRVLWLGWAAIDLGTDENPLSNRQTLVRLAQTMRMIRNVAEQDPISPRDDEVDAVASVIDLNDAYLRQHLVDVFKLPSSVAADLITELRAAKGML